MLAERQRQVTTVLAVSNLSVRYGGRPVVHDVSFSLEGGVVVLAGPNGAGKSTILRVLATLLPFEGAATLDGCDLTTAAGRRRARSRLGFLPQEAAFPGDFTVAEAVTYAAWLQRVPARTRRAAVDDALAAVDLAGRAATPLKELSTGLRRRAFLAQAIVHHPPVLLLDEPTAGVDTEHRAGFRRMVRSLAEDRLIVLSTHLTEEIEFLADRILVLGAGRVRFDGTPDELESMAGAMVTAAGTPGTPGLIELSTLVPALTFAAMWVAVGAGAGYRFGSPLVAPLATVASFSIILFLYVVDYDLVRVGGATASLLGLAPRSGLQVGQTALYLATAVWAILWAGRARGEGFAHQLPSRMAGALAAAVALGLFVNQGPDFRRRPVTFRCSGDPPICLAPGYDQHPDRVRAELTPYLEALREIGAPLPRRFEQGRSSDLVGYVSEELALGHVDPDLNEPVGAFMSAYGGYTCRTYDDRRLNESWDGLNSWLKAVGGNRYVLDFPGLPEVLRTGSKEEQAAWLRNAIDRLRRCA